MDFAQITFQGRLTDDPELLTYGTGTSVCKFTVACNQPTGKGEEKTAYIPTAVFGSQAAICAEYLSKGREVQVVGKFEVDSYTDKTGVQRKGFGCVAHDVRFGRGGRKEEVAAPETEEEIDLTKLDEETIRRVRAIVKSTRG